MWIGLLLLALELTRVWAIHDGERIDQNDLRSPLSSKNHAWDGKRIRLFGGRNEIVAFQLILQAGPGGARKVTVALPRLERGNDAIVYRAPDVDPSQTVGRPIQLFVERYMTLAQPTAANWIVATPEAAPTRPTGPIPVQLVPENARQNGLPTNIAPNSNQAIWFDIYVDRNRRPGLYRGTVTVTAGAEQISVPVELEVFDFVLPDENSLDVMAYFEPAQVELYHGKERSAAYHRVAHRHRIELVHEYDIETVRRHLGRFRGGDFTSEAGYEGPGERNGNKFVPRSFWEPGPKFENRRTAWPAANAWMRFLKRKLPRAITFLYLPDEPRPEHHAAHVKLGKMLKANPGPGKELPLFVTAEPAHALESVIDIWCTIGLAFDPGVAEQEYRQGRDVWFYNGGRPQTGATILDAPLTDPRVLAWSAFKHGIPVFFYWHSVHWKHNHQKVGERVQDVWSNPVTFDNRGQPGKPPEHTGMANGDGVLFYPGEEVLHPSQNRAVEGPVTSLRLASLRRGLQDHLYLTLALKRGYRAEVDSLLEQLVAHVFLAAGKNVRFAQDGDSFERARYTLARLLSSPT